MRQDSGVDGTVAEMVEKKARELKRNSVFRSMEAEDIGQMIWTRLLEKGMSLAPESPKKAAFLHATIRNVGRDMIDRMGTRKETFQRGFSSLDDEVGYDEHGFAVTRGCQLRDPCPASVDELAFAELHGAFMEQLSDERRELVANLEYNSQRKVAAKMNLPYSSLRHHHIRPMQDKWREIAGE